MKVTPNDAAILTAGMAKALAHAAPLTFDEIVAECATRPTIKNPLMAAKWSVFNAAVWLDADVKFIRHGWGPVQYNDSHIETFLRMWNPTKGTPS